MTTVRRFRLIVSLLPIAIAVMNPIHADGLGPGEDDPIELSVTEAPIGSSTCGALSKGAIITQSLGAEGGVLTIRNNASTTSADALMFTLVVNSETRLFWVPVSLEHARTTTIDVEKLQAFDFSVVALCGNAPDGIVDSPDPVVDVKMHPPIEE